MVPSYFFHLVSQCVVNAWIIHCEICGNDSYLKFLSSIAISLCNSTSDVVPEEFLLPSTKRVKTGYISESVCFDRYDHWAHLMELKNAMRCKNEGCKRKTMHQCSKCKVFLCVNKGTCFLEFHGVD